MKDDYNKLIVIKESSGTDKKSNDKSSELL